MEEQISKALKSAEIRVLTDYPDEITKRRIFEEVTLDDMTSNNSYVHVKGGNWIPISHIGAILE